MQLRERAPKASCEQLWREGVFKGPVSPLSSDVVQRSLGLGMHAREGAEAHRAAFSEARCAGNDGVFCAVARPNW